MVTRVKTEEVYLHNEAKTRNHSVDANKCLNSVSIGNKMSVVSTVMYSTLYKEMIPVQ